MGTASHDKSSRKRKRSEIEDQSLQDEKELGGDSQPQNEKSKVLKKSKKGDADKSFEEHKQPKNEKKRKKEKNASAVVDDDKNQTGDDIHSETREPKPKKEKKAKKTSASNVDNEDLQQNSQNNSKKMKKASAQDENDKDLVKGDVQGKKGKKRKRDSEVEEDISENVKENKKPGNKVKTKGKKKDAEIDLGGVSQPKKEKKTKKEKALDGNEEAENEDQEQKKENISRTDKLISSVLDYLHQWKNNAETWKFSKYYQSCLINYLNDPVIINEEDFESCLQYLKKCEGRALKKLKMKAAAVIEENKNSGAKVNKTPECDSDEKKQKKKKEDSKKNWNDNCILFVKNLPYGQTKDELYHGLRRIFTSASDIRMPFNDKRKHIGFAFIEFSQPSEVTLALSEKKGVRMSGRPLYLDCIGSKNKSFQRGSNDKRHSLSPEYVEAEKLRRANQVIQVFG